MTPKLTCARLIIPIVLAVQTALTGCGGGGGGSSATLPAASSGAPAGSASVALTLTIPQSTSSHFRRVKYVSASTQSAVVQYQGQQQVLSCVTSCSTTLSVTPGVVTFGVNLYDGPTGTGDLLSTGSTTATITPNNSNALSLSLGGVIASLAIALGTSSVVSGSATTIPVTVSAHDAAQNTIIGSDAYATPIALATDDTSGATSLSTKSVTSPSTSVTMSYNGSSAVSAVHVSASVAGTNVATQTATLAVAGTATSSHKFYYGAFAPSQNDSDATLASQEANLLALGTNIARTSYDPSYIDLTYKYGSYPNNLHYDPAGWARADRVISWLMANHIVPYFDISDNGVQNANTSQNRYRAPADYGVYCAAVAQHVKATYPTIGSSVPAMFGTPENEPNNNPGSPASTEAPYMKSCYAGLKSVFPNATVYGGELGIGIVPPNDSITYLNSLYANGCKTGVCWDAWSVHGLFLDPNPCPTCERPGPPLFNNATEPGFTLYVGWRWGYVADLQAVATSHGDPIPHLMDTEFGVIAPLPSGYGPNGQAKYLTDSFVLARQNATIDGAFWMNVDQDSEYVGTEFYGGGLVDVNGNRRPAFYAYQALQKN